MSIPRYLWCVDFEFLAPAGEPPRPHCAVFQEYHSGRQLRLWLGGGPVPCPIPIGPDSALVAYYASAELGCYLALDWDLPTYVLDLYAEFRNLTNGRSTPAGNSLLGALAYFGLDAMAAAEKEEMRNLALRGGPYNALERQALLDYCATDVAALTQLLGALWPRLDWPRALLRGRYMAAVARMERTGTPLDVAAHRRMQANWVDIQDQLIARIDAAYGVYTGRTFKRDRFAAYLEQQGIPWPRLASGQLTLDDDTFKDMARAYPLLHPLRELRATLGQMRLTDLAIGADGRNRTLLSAFRARTGRNQPSTSQYIFGPSTWLRGLIKPAPGYGLAYLDWSQQEFGIAAALSQDPAMIAAYQSGDPYLAFAIQAGAVPPHATKHSHGTTRDQFKACVLAVQYGMGAKSLATRINQSEPRARELLDLHRRTYPVFWRWSDGCLDHALLTGRLWTTYGWHLHLGADPNARSLRNFPMQANGAEMLRLACDFTTEAGIAVCAPVHDALLIEAPLVDLDATVTQAQALITRASENVLSGFPLGSEAKLIRYPERYQDPRGAMMWQIIWSLIGIDPDQPPDTPSPPHAM